MLGVGGAALSELLFSLISTELSLRFFFFIYFLSFTYFLFFSSHSLFLSLSPRRNFGCLTTRDLVAAQLLENFCTFRLLYRSSADTFLLSSSESSSWSNDSAVSPIKSSVNLNDHGSLDFRGSLDEEKPLLSTKPTPSYPLNHPFRHTHSGKRPRIRQSSHEGKR